MTYQRVIPRDLFNEGSLLNCLGLLALKLEDEGLGRHSCRIDHLGGAFAIAQSEADGSITCANVLLSLRGEPLPHFRPLNARSPNPLWVQAGEEDVPVFTEDGRLSPEFRALIDLPTEHNGEQG